MIEAASTRSSDRPCSPRAWPVSWERLCRGLPHQAWRLPPHSTGASELQTVLEFLSTLVVGESEPVEPSAKKRLSHVASSPGRGLAEERHRIIIPRQQTCAKSVFPHWFAHLFHLSSRFSPPFGALKSVRRNASQSDQTAKSFLRTP